MSKFLFLQIIFTFIFAKTLFAYGCGEEFSLPVGGSADGLCSCDLVGNEAVLVNGGATADIYCCGHVNGNECRTYEDENTYGCGDANDNDTIPEGAECLCEGGQWESYWMWGWWDQATGNRAICCGWTNADRTQCLNAPPGANDVYCGTEFDPKAEPKKECICSNQGPIPGKTIGNTQCCGWLRDGVCQSTDVGINDVEVTSETLNSLNPIKIGSGSTDLSTPGGIISRALKFFVFPIASIILFVVLILGGFQILVGANNSKSLEEGKQRITTAIIGFILLFAAYWFAQLLEIIFGIRILS